MDNQVSHLSVSSSPHIRSGATTTKIMGTVIIALMPALVASVIIFGPRALLVTAVTVAAAVLFEFAWCHLRHQPDSIQDLSAVVTGLLLAFNVPSTIPLWMPVVGAFVSIVIVKELFGGIGRNFANPAIVGRMVLAVSFTSRMTAFPFPNTLSGVDALTSATPLAAAGNGAQLPYLDLLLGTHGGVLGETCSLALIIGGVFLIAVGTIKATIPVTYLATVAVISLLTGHDVLYIGFSSGLSGTYNAGRMAAEELREEYPNSTVLTVDSLCASLGQGMLVYQAALQKAGGKTIEEVHAFCEETKLKVAHWFTVDDLHQLKRGGRISGATALIGTMLNIKPVLHVDNEGKLINMSKARGRNGAIQALVDRMEKTAVEPEKQTIFISHGNCYDEAKKLAELVHERFGCKSVINFVGPTIGAHSGQGTLALFYIGTER